MAVALVGVTELDPVNGASVGTGVAAIEVVGVGGAPRVEVVGEAV